MIAAGGGGEMRVSARCGVTARWPRVCYSDFPKAIEVVSAERDSPVKAKQARSIGASPLPCVVANGEMSLHCHSLTHVTDRARMPRRSNLCVPDRDTPMLVVRVPDRLR
jgi:hypothetical protein